MKELLVVKNITIRLEKCITGHNMLETTIRKAKKLLL